MNQNQQNYKLLLTKSVIELERFLLVSFVKTRHLLLLLQALFETSKLLFVNFVNCKNTLKW